MVLSSACNCSNCTNLKMGILSQINAFKILASINPHLSWSILVQNIEELIAKDTKESLKVQVKESSTQSELDCSADQQRTEDEKPTQEIIMENNVITEEGQRLVEVIVQKELTDETNSDEVLKSANLKEADVYIDTVFKRHRQMHQCLICYTYTSRSLHDARLHVTKVCQVRHKDQCKFKSVIKKKKILKPVNNKKKNSKTHQKGNHVEIIKKEQSFPQKCVWEQKDLIVVRNPCHNFNLNQTLSAFVKLDRLNLQNDSTKIDVDLMCPSIVSSSPYEDMPEMTLHQHFDSPGNDIGLDTDDTSNLIPPILTPIETEFPPVCVQSKNTCQNKVQSMQEESTPVDNELNEHSLSQLENFDLAHRGDRKDKSILLSTSEQSEKEQADELSNFMPRASLDQVDSKIFAKVDTSRKTRSISYHCKDCVKIFKDMASIRRHVRLNHFMERKICYKCKKKFPDSFRLRKHSRLCTKSTEEQGKKQ